MHRAGIEPTSIGWQPIIIPLNQRCLKGSIFTYIFCTLENNKEEFNAL
ncbi:hypothetical protein AAJ76_2000104962 [Vairimorpha ceranae]|uniref:Uncharacterized protein n=1 Tax=Vairimorpha ceranae TaxID=40302 RepID=A0A0F9ZH13_9MICR|nr:hypothetical protein AAJ76_2000104962 [Vairimorpha ceranae]KKO76564.1 hypothetical protein AAJ76_2000104962 [Vairimorpha ceranae]